MGVSASIHAKPKETKSHHKHAEDWFIQQGYLAAGEGPMERIIKRNNKQRRKGHLKRIPQCLSRVTEENPDELTEIVGDNVVAPQIDSAKSSSGDSSPKSKT